MRAAEVRKDLACLALLAPVIVLYVSEYLGDPARSFTGFIQYDQPYYMALAREVARPGFHLLYGNPFSADPATPAIYFQPHLFLLGLVEKLTGIDPGVLYVVFGFVAALACLRVAMALYEEVAGLRTAAQWIGLALFIWGGGILALTGLVYHLLNGSSFATTMTDLFRFDPAQGWWFLNFGRNLVFPTEAYYHALALGTALSVIRRNFRAALWLIFVLALSHPFTGLQFLLVVLAWCVAESVAGAGANIPAGFRGMLIVLLGFHLSYNLMFLNQFPEHRSLAAQWRLPWTEPLASSTAADLLAGILAYVAWRRGRWQLATSPVNRFLVVWFLVSFALVHHDLLLPPIQPLHFSRGYVWIPLFLLGTSALNRCLEHTLTMRAGRRIAALACIFLLGFFDNAAWFGLHTVMALGPRLEISWLVPDGFHVTRDTRKLYSWLNDRPGAHDELLISPDPDSPVIYLAMTYTGYRSWYSHFAATPFADQRQAELKAFADTGSMPKGWQNRTLFLILDSTDPRQNSPGESPVYITQKLVVYKIPKPLNLMVKPF